MRTAFYGIIQRGLARLHPSPSIPLPSEGRGKTERRGRKGASRGFLEVDLLVGLAILSLAIVPLGYSFARERQVLKMEYFRSVANEIVDGEMEILAADDAKNYPDGSQVYTVLAQAAASLPAGHFQLTKTGNHLRLEWNSDEKHGIGAVVREINIK